MNAPLPDRLRTIQARATAAYVRHAARPDIAGAWEEHLRYWMCAYAARSAFNDGNPVFSGRLLPKEGTAASGTVTGLPLLPSGVRWALDESAPNTLVISVDLAAEQGVSALVDCQGTLLTAAVTTTPTRTTITVPAIADGIYTVLLRTVFGPLATVLVPVQRTVFRHFREDARRLGFAFRSVVPPQPTDAMRLRLALSIGAEAAAQTGDKQLSDVLREEAEALPPPDAPTALFPFHQ